MKTTTHKAYRLAGLLRAVIAASEAADAEHDKGVTEVLEAAEELANEIIDDCERLEWPPSFAA